MKKFLALFCVMILCFSVVGCGSKELKKADGKVEPNKNISEAVHKAEEKDDISKNKLKENFVPEEIPAPEEVTNIAMYIPINDWHLFANETGPFVLLGEKIEYLDIDGNVITENDLVAGNKVEITSSGIMLLSYPGQLSGVTKVKVVEVGSPEDVSDYQEFIDELSSGLTDETEIPSMNVLYKTESADVSVLVEHNGGYQWTVGDKAEVADAVSSYDSMDTIPIANIGEKVDINLTFSSEATSVTVNKLDTENKDAEPEKISVEMEENSYTIKDATVGLYVVYAEFQYGDVEYRFLCEE